MSEYSSLAKLHDQSLHRFHEYTLYTKDLARLLPLAERQSLPIGSHTKHNATWLPGWMMARLLPRLALKTFLRCRTDAAH